MSKLNHIENLYRPQAQTILLFKECWALEKIHGTAASVNFTSLTNVISFHSGGESHEKFVALFDQEKLLQEFKNLGVPNDKTVICFGEAYGGKQQGMSETYGKNLKFVIFDVQMGETFLNVPDAESVASKLGIEFVHYRKVSTDLATLDAERDAPSIQAIRNGISSCVNLFGQTENPKPREGVVLRPLVEMTLNNGERIIAKHKGDTFKETATPRPVVDPSKMKTMDDANAVANEWCTANRLKNVLDKMPGHCMEKMREIITSAQEDIKREGAGEIVWSDAVAKAISKKTVDMYKEYLKSKECFA